MYNELLSSHVTGNGDEYPLYLLNSKEENCLELHDLLTFQLPYHNQRSKSVSVHVSVTVISSVFFVFVSTYSLTLKDCVSKYHISNVSYNNYFCSLNGGSWYGRTVVKDSAVRPVKKDA